MLSLLLKIQLLYYHIMIQNIYYLNKHIYLLFTLIFTFIVLSKVST